jgi:hypothetical protein
VRLPFVRGSARRPARQVTRPRRARALSDRSSDISRPEPSPTNRPWAHTARRW